MIKNIQRIAIVAGILFLIYLYFSKKKKTSFYKENNYSDVTPIHAEHSPKSTDIILAHLSTGENAILWNCKANVAYHYSIKDMETNTFVVNENIVPNSQVAKIKNIPIQIGGRYEVTVGDTKLYVIFDPPTVLENESIFSPTFTEVRTNHMPTGVEIIMDGEKISDEHVGIFGDPKPGIRIDIDVTGCKELIIMVYNGPNAAYIFSRNNNETKIENIN